MALSKYAIYLYGVLLLAGCANIRVESMAPDLAVANNPDTSVTAKITLEPFEIISKNQSQTVIGEARVGAFNVPVEYDANEKVSSIIETSVKKGFSGAGFKIVELSDADLVVSGLVDKFWVSEQLGSALEYSKASVRYDLIIRNRKGAIVWANSIDVFKTSERSLDATDSDIPTLTLCLKESVESIFKDKSFWDALSSY